jgi:hypothetical protein
MRAARHSPSSKKKKEEKEKGLQTKQTVVSGHKICRYIKVALK